MAKPEQNLEQASESDDAELEAGSDDPSASDVPASKMKGDKKNPLRRWAEAEGSY